MNLKDEPILRRRRGDELETALLEATWAEVVEHGYGALTFDAVAQRAGTSRPVLYRRWSTRAELVRAAVARVGRHDPITMPDSGTLRGDLLAMAQETNEKRVDFGAIFVIYLGGYFLETGTSPADLRHDLRGDGPSSFDTIIDRAVARGEVDAARLTPRKRSLAFDLYRHDALMNLGPVPEQTMVEIVDEIVLPVLIGPAYAAP